VDVGSLSNKRIPESALTFSKEDKNGTQYQYLGNKLEIG
jgi:type VI protein secretion system component Hcp